MYAAGLISMPVYLGCAQPCHAARSSQVVVDKGEYPITYSGGFRFPPSRVSAQARVTFRGRASPALQAVRLFLSLIFSLSSGQPYRKQRIMIPPRRCDKCQDAPRLTESKKPIDTS